MPVFLACALLLAGSVRAAEAPSEAVDAPAGGEQETGSPEARLAAAIQAYLSGELETAREGFLSLVADPGLQQSHPEVRREAQVYLGSLDYNLGDRDAAQATFLSILLEDPDYQLDPFAHPPELLAYFDAVRAQADVLRPPPPPEPRPRPNPLLLVVPGGLQFYNDQRGYGAVVLTGVAGLALTTGALNLGLRGMDEDRNEPGIQVYSESDKQFAQRLKDVNNVTGWSTVALWSLTFLHGALVSTLRDSPRNVSVVGPNVVVRF